jgi:lipopolysaccharide export system protein LptA
MKNYIFIIILGLMTLPAYAASDIVKNHPEEPLEITSNKMEAFHEKNLVIFSGNACVTKGNTLLKADRIFLYYKKEADRKNKVGVVDIGGSGELDRVEAKGHVVLTQNNRTAFGEEAFYWKDSNKIILTGNALLKEGKNSIRGDRVIIFLNEDRGIVESDSQKQVKAIIYPQEKQTLREKSNEK